MIPHFAGLAGPGFSLEKKLRKKFRKNLEVNQKSPYLCSRFPNETEATEEAIFDEFT